MPGSLPRSCAAFSPASLPNGNCPTTLYSCLSCPTLPPANSSSPSCESSSRTGPGSRSKPRGRFREPTNGTILEEFQKYVSQASVESYAIKRRNLFLEKAFEHYLDPKTKGRIIGGTQLQ